MKNYRKRSSSDYIESYAEVGEIELNPVKIWYDLSPAEPDVNWGGDLEITSVEYQGKDVLPDMSAAEVDAVLQQVSEFLTSYEEDWRY